MDDIRSICNAPSLSAISQAIYESELDSYDHLVRQCEHVCAVLYGSGNADVSGIGVSPRSLLCLDPL